MPRQISAVVLKVLMCLLLFINYYIMDIFAKGFSCSAVRLQKYGGSIRSCSETRFEKVCFFFQEMRMHT
jgi:hypothetical protein